MKRALRETEQHVPGSLLGATAIYPFIIAASRIVDGIASPLHEYTCVMVPSYANSVITCVYPGAPSWKLEHE